jgi:hypothetical protein
MCFDGHFILLMCALEALCTHYGNSFGNFAFEPYIHWRSGLKIKVTSFGNLVGVCFTYSTSLELYFRTFVLTRHLEQAVEAFWLDNTIIVCLLHVSSTRSLFWDSVSASLRSLVENFVGMCLNLTHMHNGALFWNTHVWQIFGASDASMRIFFDGF